MRILVTGASGYLGSWLAPRLHEQGHVVAGFDRQPRPDLPMAGGWHEGDITDLEALMAAAQGCDALVHLAVLPQYRSEEDPAADLVTNTLGTLQALRAARASGIRRFVLASTSAIYGAHSGLLNEDIAPAPVTPYGASKAAAESYCNLFARSYGLHTTILRMFQIYGHNQAGDLRITVEGQFLRAVLAGRPPVIHGNPENGFDFIHTDDVLRAFELALLADLPAGLTLNIGSGAMTTLTELARWCMEAVGLSGEPELAAGAGQMVERRPSQVADITRARRHLGYAPTRHLRDWVFETVAGQARGPVPTNAGQARGPAPTNAGQARGPVPTNAGQARGPVPTNAGQARGPAPTG